MTLQKKESGNQRGSSPVLTPPREEIPHPSPSPYVVGAVLSGLVLLVLLSALVIWLLPSKINRNAQSPPVARLSPPEVQKPEGVPLHQREAERLLGEWLKRRARAETENLAVWGGSEYAEILRTADLADRMFRSRAFPDAQTYYREAVDAFDTLLATQNDKLGRALQAGLQALKIYETDTAIRAFEQALAIDPLNEDAGRGIERARILEQALLLYNEGLSLEKQDNLEGAQKFFREAVETDSELIPAAAALDRVRSRLEDIRYQKAMSSALSALEREDLQAADQAVSQALALKPDEPAVRAAAERLREKKVSARILALRHRADRMTAEEKWGDVLQIYEQALKIDPAAGFAVTGRIEAEKRFQLDRSINGVLAKPERLQDPGPLDEAKRILARSESIENAGPVLRSQTSRLRQLITEAATPVNVTLRSDNATTVEIYHVGIFPPFYEKRLALRPGNYTIVGRRRGYRDVRMTVDVKPDDSPPLFIFIRCEDPL